MMRTITRVLQRIQDSAVQITEPAPRETDGRELISSALTKLRLIKEGRLMVRLTPQEADVLEMNLRMMLRR